MSPPPLLHTRGKGSSKIHEGGWTDTTTLTELPPPPKPFLSSGWAKGWTDKLESLGWSWGGLGQAKGREGGGGGGGGSCCFLFHPVLGSPLPVPPPLFPQSYPVDGGGGERRGCCFFCLTSFVLFPIDFFPPVFGSSPLKFGRYFKKAKI